MSNDEDQLMLLKQWTQMTGTLHEAQTEQLKYWPLMLTHAIKAEILFDFETRTVIYNIQKTEGKKPKDLPKRLKMLEFYTKWLLGDDYKVIVQKGKAIWFYSKGVIDGSGQTSNTSNALTKRGGSGVKRVAKKKGSAATAPRRSKNV